MFCPRCGMPHDPEARFCSRCGTPVEAAQTPKAPGTSAAVEPEFQFQEVPDGPAPATPAPFPPSAAATPARENFLLKHWRGHYPLWFSYWIIGTVLTIPLVLLLHLAGKLDVIKTLGGRPAGFYIGFVCLSALAITAWQLVGIWRSATRYRAAGGKRAWALAAKTMIVLAIISSGHALVAQYVPLLKEAALLIADRDDTPPCAFRLLRNGTELELSGGMRFGTAEELRNILNATPTVKIIHLNSGGGRINEAILIARLIRERGLITYTSSECDSACTLAYLAGRERLLSNRARLGFHSASIGGAGAKSFKDINDEFEQAMEAVQATRQFIRKALSTDNEHLWFPDSEELLANRIVTAVVDPKHYGLSGIDPQAESSRMEAELLNIPFYAQLRQHDPGNYTRLMDVLRTGVQDGISGFEVQQQIRGVFTSEILPIYLNSAPDDELLDYWRTQMAEIHYLRSINPQYCSDFIFPQFAKAPFDPELHLPRQLLNDDLQALGSLIQATALGPVTPASRQNVAAELGWVMRRIGEDAPWALQVLRSPADYRDDPAALSDATLVFYTEILNLPDARRSAAVLRSLFSK